MAAHGALYPRGQYKHALPGLCPPTFRSPPSFFASSIGVELNLGFLSFIHFVLRGTSSLLRSPARTHTDGVVILTDHSL